MYWATRFFKHLLFCFGADAVKNPEKYAHYARKGKQKAQDTAEKVKAQAQCTYRNVTDKESVKKAQKTAKTGLSILVITALIALFLSMVFPVFLFFFVLTLIAIVAAKFKG